MRKSHTKLTEEEQAEREAKLPRWARMELDRLRANAKYDAKRLAEKVTPKTAVWCEPYGDDPRPVAEIGAPVRFALPGADHMDYFHVSIDEDGVLHVHGGQSIFVGPTASNVMDVFLGQRRFGPVS